MSEAGGSDGKKKASEEERAEVAYGATKQLLLAIGLGKAEVPKEFAVFIEKAVIVALTQHGDHLASHGVEQEHADPYKVVSWLGCSILEQLPCAKNNPKKGHPPCGFRIVADALVRTLAGLLKRDSGGKVELPMRTRKLLVQMLVAEKTEKKQHGIWQNGLYVALHCAVTTAEICEDSE